MKQRTEIKIQLTIPLIILILASIACNMLELEATAKIFETGVELCYTADRSEYIDAANQVGQIVDTPKYPENAVYEVCHISGKVTSARMTEGEAPESSDAAGNEGTGSIPAGLYTGEFYFNEDHSENTELMSNEITVNISNSGIVDGSANLQFNNTLITTEPEHCKHYTETGSSYTISGQIYGNDRETVEVHKSTHQIIAHTPCGDYERTDDECSCEGILTVSDGELKIRCGSDSDCGVVIFANR